MKTREFRPLGKRVLIKNVKTDIRSSGGIILPEQKNTVEAVVLRVSHEVKNIQEGDRVIFDRYSGIEIKAEEFSDPLILIGTEYILAKVVLDG